VNFRPWFGDGLDDRPIARNVLSHVCQDGKGGENDFFVFSGQIAGSGARIAILLGLRVAPAEPNS
jgi:hypothetical protein